MMKTWQAVKRLLPMTAMFGLFLAGCGREDLSVLRPQGPAADRSYGLMELSISIMIVVLLIVFTIAAYVLIRFRRRPGQNEIPEQVEGSIKLEILWTVIPLILVVVLAVPTVKAVFAAGDDHSNDKNAIKVKVTGHQYWWEFEYTDYKVTTAQDLIIPVGKDIAFELETKDVLHSFWVPSLSGKIDTNPAGTINRFSFSAPNEGVYRGKCAELCGPSHGLMEFKVKSVSEQEFQKWIDSMKAPVAVLPEDPALAEKFKAACLTCHAVGDQGINNAPNLTGISSRESIAGILLNDDTREDGAPIEENLKTWLHDPQSVKPGNLMPNPKDLGLSDAEIDGIAEYLANYKLD
ncbi:MULTISPECIES: cytochrome c oxidase subunit II [Paenibacillus]|uniref:Cytochrome c oxidase subunit 2 n=1 Tax=Paenibacillus odorifer TaxID=189426 RepID=A0A1R0WWU2_9BACL|nr:MULTISPECIES: cytochrome c oxidase subunit II [Paenibacillus]ETT59070.1 cytochrome c oxidase subunit II [Paenibacillus sp. FSL H8-237]OMD23195.1 cytochrome c oxidase subunit II [Paenibacillus odorifer]OME19607.1 cytochrome c oxidase subunit II [Paenibacillus odorifer]OME29731.1 cytochrome c oxidase subunit II [Paenibacillus odorifer]OME35414.1 cytochrome c oxidase subunit II [Paenibacillus odorifer]